MTARPSTLSSVSSRFSSYIARKTEEYGDKFDASDLSNDCIPHYNAGELRRVKVEWPDGTTQWGRIGVTTGWRPTFILLRDRRAVSSSVTLSPNSSYKPRIVDWRDLAR
jgi:hypothetical protein